MTCASCVRRVEQALENVDGVVSATVNLATELAGVDVGEKVDAESLTAAVRNAGYGARIVAPERNAMVVAAERRLRRRADVRRRARQLGVGVLLSGVTLLLSYGFGSWRWSGYLQLAIALPVWLWVGWKFHRGALRAARHGSANMDTLVSLGSSVAFVYSAVAVFVLPGQAIFFDVAALIVTLISVGKLLEVVARGRASGAIEALVGLQPRTARLLARAARSADWRDATPVDFPVDGLRVGDIVLIRPGERVPTDGVIIDGSGAVDESMLTGESVPAVKRPGNQAIGATVNGTSALVIRVTRVGSETTLAHILAIVERAQTEKAPVQRLADQVSAIFVPAILLIAAATFVGWMLSGHSFVVSMIPAVAVLVVACPCALGLATPVAVMVGTGRGAELGLLIRGGESLERIHALRAIVFDKTGTLTEGSPKVVDVIPIGGRVSAIQALALAGSLEQASEHPLARAIVASAAQNGALVQPASVEAVPGGGVRGEVHGTQVLVGSLAWLKGQGIPTADAERPAAVIGEHARTAIAVSIDGSVAALIAVADPIRADSRAGVDHLRQFGLHVVLASGDREATTRAIADEVGIADVHSQLSPEDKASLIRSLRSSLGPVAMVGDGINDAPALALADVGIALGTGTGVAMETADITLVHGDIEAVSVAIALSRATLRIIRQNLAWAFGYNLVLVPLAIASILPPIVAALAMACSSVTVVLNALRLRHFSPQRRQGSIGATGETQPTTEVAGWAGGTAVRATPTNTPEPMRHSSS